uniref:Phosphorylated adapter RNA export protein n=1 Tax=Rhizophora mucronata TaxID=61149 RepID=A0A2P2IKU3_RHIMU
MEKRETVLEAIYEDDNVEDTDDVEMLDVEEGELVEHKSQADVAQRAGGGDNTGIQRSQTKNQKRRQNKKKNKKRMRGGLGHNYTDINRFVLDTCRRLKEKKSYMVYTAVGCLGVAALSDLVKEVQSFTYAEMLV